MDTLIGNVTLTQNQISRLESLKVAPFVGGSYKSDSNEYIAVSLETPSDGDIENLRTLLTSLPDESLEVSVSLDDIPVSEVVKHLIEAIKSAVAKNELLDLKFEDVVFKATEAKGIDADISQG